MGVAKDISPSGKAFLSQGSILDPGITYNQAGTTYNQANITYGGFYGFSDVVPIIARMSNYLPQGAAGTTNAQLLTSTITYNENGVTFNDSRYQYGGVYGNSDVRPITSLVASVVPHIVGYGDIYTPGGGTNTAIPLAPGFFMFITH